ncbi:DUF4351 domain-containing protein [Magnetovirga frankeli]|uniref:DUF4351 domain-containing protein n=1 Tax=Magnetovirga frankeli TaxID=947516 RepID=UPI0012936437|nr:DUF4351 domain-containing protein [gamma proteobacterium SS-5]
MDHDQNYKNLILDYPREALAFFAAAEAQAIDAGARIVPVREEQLKERLGERFRELDVPLLVEWSDGRRSAILFVLEEETDPKRFSIHRLAHYCLDLAELFDTERLVPVVIFLHPGSYPEQLRLGSENRDYLHFSYLSSALFATPANQYLDSPNIVARLTLPCMDFAPEDKLAIYAAATRGLMELEPNPERRLKYADFIDIYTALDDNELKRYQQDYAEENKAMTALSVRFTEKGIQQGMQLGRQEGRQEGRQQGEAELLLRQISRKFGPQVAQQHEAQIRQAALDSLEHWADAILSAESPDELFE